MPGFVTAQPLEVRKLLRGRTAAGAGPLFQASGCRGPALL